MIRLVSAAGDVVINVSNISYVTFASNSCNVQFEKGHVIILFYESNPELTDMETAITYFENLK
ncbi:MAG: hypothetical protein PHN88_09095 [Ignavibacteria bacterium]|nr:hypothetical protein [Ignavibacteria bacterium]